MILSDGVSPAPKEGGGGAGSAPSKSATVQGDPYLVLSCMTSFGKNSSVIITKPFPFAYAVKLSNEKLDRIHSITNLLQRLKNSKNE